MSDALKVVSHIIIIANLITALIIAFQDNYAHAAYLMSIAIFLEVAVGKPDV